MIYPNNIYFVNDINYIEKVPLNDMKLYISKYHEKSPIYVYESMNDICKCNRGMSYRKIGLYNFETNVFVWTPFIYAGIDTDGYLRFIMKIPNGIINKEMVMDYVSYKNYIKRQKVRKYGSAYDQVENSDFYTNMQSMIDISSHMCTLPYYKTNEIESIMKYSDFADYDDDFNRDNKCNYIEIYTDSDKKEMLENTMNWVIKQYPENVVPVPIELRVSCDYFNQENVTDI